MRAKLKAYSAAGEDPPETWAEVRRGAFDADPDAVDKMAEQWAENIGKAVGTPSKFTSPGKVHVLGKALILWSEALAGDLTKYLVEELGLRDELGVAQEMDDEDAADLEF
jgi:DNA-binding ferritin-like protein